MRQTSETHPPQGHDQERHATDLLRASATLVEAARLVDAAAGVLNYGDAEELTEGRDLQALAETLRQRGQKLGELANVARAKSASTTLA